MVAAKFFPVDDPDGSYPLCERDYFARLDLICGQCDKALRGSYITACSKLKPLAEASFSSLLIFRKSFAVSLDKKFHVEHFTCSACATVFGPQDSYYEHDDQVCEWHSPAQHHLSLGLIRRLFPDCHFHYSTRFATKCVGCANAILKQFVEINRNQKDECWHPECYMIHKASPCQVGDRGRYADARLPTSILVLECQAHFQIQGHSSQLHRSFNGVYARRCGRRARRAQGDCRNSTSQTASNGRTS